MCFMEHTRPPAGNHGVYDADHALDLRCMIAAMVEQTSMATHMNTGVNGGAWVHLARSPEFLWVALNAVYNRGLSVGAFINVPNSKGHSPYDTNWSNHSLRNIIEQFDGVSVYPMPSAHGKGKKGSGKGKGRKDGLGPEHHWNRQYHKQGQGM